MTLDWDMILGKGDHKKTLTAMYEDAGTIENLSFRLGVSEGAIKVKFRRVGVDTRPMGQRRYTSAEFSIRTKSARLGIVVILGPGTFEGKQQYCFYGRLQASVKENGFRHTYNPFLGYCEGEEEAEDFLREYKKDRSYRKP